MSLRSVNGLNRSFTKVLALSVALIMALMMVPSTTAAASVVSSGSSRPANVVVQFGEDLAPAARDRIETLLRDSAKRQEVLIYEPDDPLTDIPDSSHILAFGDTTATRELIDEAELEPLGSEGFIVRSGLIYGCRAIATDGNPPMPDRYTLGIDIGVSYGAYALMEEIGFAFLHPLEPITPSRIKVKNKTVNLEEKPYWPDRGIHIHTMHPLELTELLNGWGKDGPEDEEGFYEMLDEWDQTLQWIVANRLNSVEWVLLMASSWQDFADGSERQERLAELVEMAHDWGISAGVDAPIALMQQHAWYMVRQQGTFEEEAEQIRSRIDYLMEAGFDFLGSEMGTGEFTSTDDVRFVQWMDEAARHLDESHDGKRMYMKIHCSTGQTAPNYVDPDTGEPLNYNFLPHYSDPRVSIMPHTVQVYSLDDPAPTYGNSDFDYMREFMQEEAGVREVRWHPETAYWCAYDIDVPLFLPIYAERRLYDLRLIATDEIEGRMGRGEYAGSRIQGQMFFSSGWEWGYWLNDVITARASWQPFMNISNDKKALKKALNWVVRPFGKKSGQVRDLLMRTIEAQQDLLIEGKIDGVPPEDIEKRSGMAYLECWDSLDDAGDLIGLIPFVEAIHAQPDKLHMIWLYNLFDPTPAYAEIEPLLEEMEIVFSGLAGEFEALEPDIPKRARTYYEEICDSARMTALRATQVSGLYDYVFRNDQTDEWRRDRLQTARDALDTAVEVTNGRTESYRVDPERIAGWRYNPTAYSYGYLWTSRTLWFWWRDEGKAVDRPLRAGYMNINNPADEGFGEGPLNDLAIFLRRLGDLIFPGLFEWFGAPACEPDVPPYDFRSRP